MSGKRNYEGDRVKHGTRRSKKRIFKGNQYTASKDESTRTSQTVNIYFSTPVHVITLSPPPSSQLSAQTVYDNLATPKEAVKQTVQHRKVQLFPTDTPKQTDPITGYRVIDTELLAVAFAQLSCPACSNNTITLREKNSKKYGLASCLRIKCTTCEYSYDFYTSRRNNKSYDVNKRIVYGMRTIGHGYTGLEELTACMNIPRPMSKNAFYKINKIVAAAVEDIAKETMLDTANELLNNKESTDVGVSVDGAWKRRGYASLNGLVAAISINTGKVIDVESMSRYCRQCMLKENIRKSDHDQYEIWYESHKSACKLNCAGSAGSMEVTGAKRIFSRSIESYKLRYTEFLGDGDCKSHSSIKNMYDGVEVTKLECVGHIQKRVGSRLRQLKKAQTNLGGKGKLTYNIIDKLQNYYGIAVRSNIGDLEGMKKAISASLFHVASSAKENWHVHCPDGESSWCQFKKDIATGKNTYKPGQGLTQEIIMHVKPIFQDLSKDALLERCLHGRTQNANESFNSTVWKRIPKATYVSLQTFKFGVFDAVAHFNIGAKAAVLVFEKLGMIPGRYMTKIMCKL